MLDMRALHAQGTPRDRDEDGEGSDECRDREERRGILENKTAKHGNERWLGARRRSCPVRAASDRD